MNQAKRFASTRPKANLEQPIKVFIDFGNDSIKSKALGQTQVVPSVFAPFDPSKSDYAPDAIVIDSTAYGHHAMYLRGSKQFAEVNKLEHIEQAWKVAIRPELNGKAIDLVISVPDSRSFTLDLQGPHEWLLNGQPMAVEVRSCQWVNESEGSFWVAQRKGLTKAGLTMMIDVGAGTTIASLYTADGAQVDRVVMDDQGVIKIAKLIAKGVGKGTHARISDILSGLRNGSYRLGVSEISFEPHIEQAVGAWMAQVMAKAQTIRKDRENRISSMVLTGGGATLLGSLHPHLAPKVLPNAQLANLEGMVIAHG